MKKNILLLPLLLFVFQPKAFSNENSSFPISKDMVILSAPLNGVLEKSAVAKMQEALNEKLNDDKVIAFYLTVPYEKRQYIFPMLHIMPFVSHKIKTHPEILFWKNKKPTVIAPQLKEFAQQHLNNLSPAFYTFLDPDFWKAPPKEDLFGKEKIQQNPLPELSPKNVDYVYPTVRELFKLSENDDSTYYKTDLTETDIVNFSNLIIDLDSYKPQKYDLSGLMRAVTTLTIDQPHRTIADPFLMYIYALEKVGELKSFDAFVKKHGFKNAEDFALKADNILKSYKTLSLNLLIAIQLAQQKTNYNLTALKKEDFLKPDIPLMEMYTRLHSAKPGDVYFVKKYKKQLSNIFKTRFVKYGIMISVD